MKKNYPPYGKEKINELQQALEEVQPDNTRSQEDILEVARNYKMHIRMRKITGTRKAGTCGIHLGILTQTFTML